MKTRTLLSTLLFFFALPALAAGRGGFDLSVMVDDAPLPEYDARGTVYVEALRGREYELRVTNPTGTRVAVALAVDGLNTIDAKHTPASSASKWIIEPYDSIVISGWQVSDSAARRFFFTNEESSYGAKLGKTENLGVIEAVFFRERVPVTVWRDDRRYESESSAAPAPRSAQAPTAAAGASRQKSEDYAATGMGDRKRHDVERVDLDLEPTPIASMRIRYEFRPQLVKLGVLPRSRTTLQRREASRGFGGWAPEVD